MVAPYFLFEMGKQKARITVGSREEAKTVKLDRCTKMVADDTLP